MQIQEIMKYGDYSINNKHVLITSSNSVMYRAMTVCCDY